MAVCSFNVWITVPTEASVDRFVAILARQKLIVAPAAGDGSLFDKPVLKEGQVAGSCMLAVKLTTHRTHGTEGDMTPSDMVAFVRAALGENRYLGLVVLKVGGSTAWGAGNITFDEGPREIPKLPLTSFERLTEEEA